MKTKKVITPYFENGTFAGARVCVGGEDFIIAPKDYWDGKELPWQEAMDALKADNLATWNYRQICLTMAYRKEIERYSRIMAEMALIIGYWTCAEVSDIYSFYYYGYNGALDFYYKDDTCSVRPIRNFKD